MICFELRTYAYHLPSVSGKDPAAAMGNLAVNGGVLAAGIAIFFFDQKVTSDLKNKLEEEMKNPYLKGDLDGFLDGEKEN